MSFNNWIDILKSTKYSEHPKFKENDLYPNTGNVALDWEIFCYAISILSGIENKSIEEYIYFLNFSKAVAYEMGMFDSNIEEEQISQIPIYKIKNFTLRGNIGSLVSGYTLLIPNSHYLSMSSLPNEMKFEYIEFLKEIREEYFEIWKKYPIIFEHGSNNHNLPKCNSIDHAHTHIVNHQYLNEEEIIKFLNFEEVRDIKELLELGKNTNYISYINPDGKCYFTNSHPNESQIMRKFIAQDIGTPKTWNWREYPYLENSFETIKQFVLNKKGAK